jgi:predicted adenylyl cyclase CyaB
MPTNVEIKARVRDFDGLKARIESLSGAPCEEIPQEDTFFNVPTGRLKLRLLAPDFGQLIYYRRDDASGPKRSEYTIATTREPGALKAILSATVGVRGVVRKRRLLYRIGSTRIHMDAVEGLGFFMELEVVLKDGQDIGQGATIANDLMEKLGIHPADLVQGAYIDLLERPGS